MPGGRPPKLRQRIATNTDGDPVTVHDRIVSSLAAGNYIETAAALAGVSKQSVYEWLKVGAQASTDVTNRKTTLAKLTQHQRDCIEFSDAVAEAQAQSEVRDVATLAQLARGGTAVTTKRVKKDAAGNVVETVETVETLKPDPHVLTWRLERRFPDRWGRRTLEISGPDGDAIPVEVRVAGLLAAARSRVSGREADPEVPLPADEPDEQTET